MEHVRHLHNIVRAGAELTRLYSELPASLKSIDPDGPLYEWRIVSALAMDAIVKVNEIIAHRLNRGTGASTGPMEWVTQPAHTRAIETPMEEQAIDVQLRSGDAEMTDIDEDRPMSGSPEPERSPSPALPPELTAFAATVETTKSSVTLNESVNWEPYLKAVRPWMGLIPGRLLIRTQNAKVKRLAKDVLHVHKDISTKRASFENPENVRYERYVREAREDDSLITRLYKLEAEDALGDDNV